MPGRSSGPCGPRRAPRGQVDPRAVRQQRVLHPEGRPPARPDRADEALEALRPPALQVGDDRRPPARARRAVAARAQRRGLLGGHDPVAAPAERREDRVRVVAHDRRRCPAAAPSRRGSAAPPWWSSRRRCARCGTRCRRAPARRSAGSARRRSSRSGPSRMSPPNSSKTISTTCGPARLLAPPRPVPSEQPHSPRPTSSSQRQDPHGGHFREPSSPCC